MHGYFLHYIRVFPPTQLSTFRYMLQDSLCIVLGFSQYRHVCLNTSVAIVHWCTPPHNNTSAWLRTRYLTRTVLLDPCLSSIAMIPQSFLQRAVLPRCLALTLLTCHAASRRYIRYLILPHELKNTIYSIFIPVPGIPISGRVTGLKLPRVPSLFPWPTLLVFFAAKRPTSPYAQSRMAIHSK